MNLTGAKILIAAQFAAPYEGNFIASLHELSNKLTHDFGCSIAYVFPSAMARQPWADAFIASNKTYLTGDAKCLIKPNEAKKIIEDFNPDLVYTHFEGYDLPFYFATKHLDIRTVWHMHDTLSYQRNLLKTLYQRYCFFRHYGMPYICKHDFAPCLLAVCEHELKFVRPFRFGIKTPEIVIPNGININRIKSIERHKHHSPFTFLAFGGRNVQKRTDLLMRAADSLIQQGESLAVIIVGDEEIASVAKSIFGLIPTWLKIIPPGEDINAIFAQADCFVSTSVHETFSYAIAEATIFGLPIVQSDIEGTLWNANNPSTIIFKSGDINSLSMAMSSMINQDIAILQKSCKITQQRNIQNFSIESWRDKVISFIQSIP